MRWLLTREPDRERERESKRYMVSKGEPSVSPTPWPTERAHRESVPGRHPGRDVTLPDIQTHLQSIVAVARSEPDPHFTFALCTRLVFLHLSLFLSSFDPLAPIKCKL